MAKYYSVAEKLKPLVTQQNFTPEQLNLIMRMILGGRQLRKADACLSYVKLMLPENVEIRYGQPRTRTGRYGRPYTFRPAYVIEKGAELVEPAAEHDGGDDEDGEE